jgi:DNA (cytosine-5)-methyltransferase 1
MIKTHLSLFSGVGGIDLAAEWADFLTVGQCELPGWAFEVLKQKWPDVKRWEDIRDINKRTIEDLPQISLLSGGFPCQPFSTSGKRNGKKDNRYLWHEMLRVIELVQPRWICAENVAGITSIDEEAYQVDDSEEESVYSEKILSQILEDIEQAGYLLPRATTGEAIVPIIPAYSVGACHKRNRVFIIAHSASTGKMPIQLKGPRNGTEPGYIIDTDAEETRSGELSVFGGRSQQENENFVWCARRFANIDSYGCNNRTIKRKGICREQTRFEIGTSVEPLPYFESRLKSQRFHISRNGWTREQIEKRSGDCWNEVATRLCRVDDDVPGRVDRIACLGNAVVPAQIYPVVKAIADYEEGLI